MKIVALIVGVAAVLLGGLWLLQGLGVVRLDPVACVAKCEPLEGPSAIWAVIGFVVAAAGVLAIILGLKRRAAK